MFTGLVVGVNMGLESGERYEVCPSRNCCLLGPAVTGEDHDLMTVIAGCCQQFGRFHCPVLIKVNQRIVAQQRESQAIPALGCVLLRSSES